MRSYRILKEKNKELYKVQVGDTTRTDENGNEVVEYRDVDLTIHESLEAAQKNVEDNKLADLHGNFQTWTVL